eukprot:g14.t1
MGRVALVTGGTRGIGAAIAVGLKDAGYTVAANYGGNDEAANAFKDQTGIAVYKFDVSDYDAVTAAVQTIESDLGPVEVLVNNAGITRDGTMHKMTPEQWQAVIDTNLGSCFNCSRAVIEGMRARKFGRIVNIGSINGQAGQYGQVNYAAAKSGIHGFTKALAQEGARAGITVNAIAPGYVNTDMVRAVPEDVLEKIKARIPVGRLGEADEIARGVLFLVADDAGFITGSTLSINGGQHMAERRPMTNPPAHPQIGVGVVVLKHTDAGPRVLLVKRGKPPQQGAWSLPGGRQELGERVRETARREVREEAGVEVEIVRLLDVIDAITPHPDDPHGAPAFHYTLIDFEARWLSGALQPGDDAVDAVWADPFDLDGYRLWAETARMIRVVCGSAMR